MARLPTPGGDNNQWGDILNEYLAQAHNTDGTAIDASSSSKGVIQLSGDLGGTASSPTVPGLASKADTSALEAHATSPFSGTVHGVREVHWREEDVSSWTQHIMSTDATVTNTHMLVVDGMCWIYGSGGSVTTSVRRDLWVIPGTETWEDMEVMGVWWGGPVQNGVGQPQHGFGLRVKDDAGVSKAIMVWHDTAFGIPSIQNCATWWSGQTIPTANATDAGARTVSAGSRTSELTTLTVASGHRLWSGQVVLVSVADSTYNGWFPIESVTATTITYRQSGVTDDASSGAGTVTVFNAGFGSGTQDLFRSTTVSAAARTDGVVTATVPAGHPFTIGDRIIVNLSDDTFDGSFIVSALPTSTTISWGQAGSDDASGGTGTIQKPFPYVMRVRLVGQHVDIAWRPYQGFNEANAVLAGEAAFGDPRWSASYDLSSIVGTGAPPTGQGGVAILGAHVGSAVDGAGNVTRRCVYGPIVARKL